MRQEGVTAVVAGGYRGIGAACVARLVAEGASVHVLDLAGDNPIDITDQNAVEAFVDSLPACPAVAVNAVGDANLELILEQEVAEFRRILDIELAGAYIFTQAVARRMVREGVRGSIVNVSSEQEEIPSRGLSGHCAAKAGLAMLTRVAAVELGRHGIRINAVAPGTTLTPLTEPFSQLPSYMAGVAASTPLADRMGSPDEIAAAAAFLLSDDAAWVTGRSLRVDGGQSLCFIPEPLDAIAEDAAGSFQAQVIR